MTDKPVEETTIAAQRVAEAAKRYLQVTQPDSAVPAYWELRQQVRRYEDVERRAMQEATR